jgi:hypothetical protein
VGDPPSLRGTCETKTGGRVGSETGLMVGLWERLRVRCAKVGETGEDVGVFRRTKVEMGMFADDSVSFTCLCLDSGPRFKAEGLWRGEAELVCEGMLATKKTIGDCENLPGWRVRSLFHRWKGWKHSFGGNGTGTHVVGMSGSIGSKRPHSRWARRRGNT